MIRRKDAPKGQLTTLYEQEHEDEPIREVANRGITEELELQFMGK